MELDRLGCISEAARSIGKDNSSAYRIKYKFPEFSDKWDSIYKKAIARKVVKVEHGMFDRAINGWEEPVFYLGNIVGHVRKYNVAREIFIVKSHMRERYGEHAGMDSDDARKQMQDIQDQRRLVAMGGHHKPAEKKNGKSKPTKKGETDARR